MNHLKKLGFSDWFEQRMDDKLAASHSLARIVSVHKDSYTITQGGAPVFAEIAGNLLYRADSSCDLPTTGDWVYADFYDDDSHAIIVSVFPRKTLLRRKTAGKSMDYQSIAANIDVALIVQSLNENFNLRRLERYLVMVKECGIEASILLSKCDLLNKEAADEMRKKVLHTAPNATVMAFSNLHAEQIDDIIQSLHSRMTYCLLGSSGVGKTTLLNNLIGGAPFETQSVSGVKSKGRHTTTQRQLVCLDNGAILIDTPGMRELGNLGVDEGLDETFSEMGRLAQYCQFSDCSHISEKGCAILAAIEAGELSEQRYKHYLKLKRESEFNQMSYLEKRKKDKRFGKFLKNNVKNKRGNKLP